MKIESMVVLVCANRTVARVSESLESSTASGARASRSMDRGSAALGDNSRGLSLCEPESGRSHLRSGCVQAAYFPHVNTAFHENPGFGVALKRVSPGYQQVRREEMSGDYQ
jgi:hypothetical protein